MSLRARLPGREGEAAETMRAVVMQGYGGPEVLGVEEQRLPSVSGRRLLVKVHASGINPIDWRIRRGELRPFTGLRPRRIPGRDVAGEIAAVGDGVTGFEVGDRVYAMLDGISGGYAGYAVVGEGAASTMPESLSYEEAAAVPLAALTAVQALRGALRDASTPHACETGENERRRVLVNGASGGVGTFAVQLARIFGAEVVGVSSARNAGLVRELGADHVVDYAEEDFTLHRERYDVIFDVVGNEGFTSCRKALKTGGIYVSTEPRSRNFLWQLLTFPGENRKGRAVIVRPSGRDLSLLKRLFETGKLRVVLDRVYPLEDAAEAHAYGETGRARGKLVLGTAG